MLAPNSSGQDMNSVSYCLASSRFSFISSSSSLMSLSYIPAFSRSSSSFSNSSSFYTATEHSIRSTFSLLLFDNEMYKAHIIRTHSKIKYIQVVL